MGDKTGIEWTDATWNPVTGCTKVSQGCKHCYAERVFPRAYPGRQFTSVTTHPERLYQPMRWRRRRMIFVNSMSDLFHEDVPDSFIDQVFAVMALARHHVFQVLTKRPERMRQYLHARTDPTGVLPIRQATGEFMALAGFPAWPWALPLPNVWLGVSVEDQATADERIPLLLDTPAAVRWISAEPLLGEVDLERVRWPGKHPVDVLRRGAWDLPYRVAGFTNHSDMNGLDWVVAGGESGPKARPSHPGWFRLLRAQCVGAGVPFLFKQWGEWAPGECAGYPMVRTERCAELDDSGWSYGHVTPGEAAGMHCDDEPDVYRIGKSRAGRTLDGEMWNQYPPAEAPCDVEGD